MVTPVLDTVSMWNLKSVLLFVKKKNKHIVVETAPFVWRIFVHKNNKAYLQYSYNSANVIRNINNVQRIAFNNLPATYTQKQKTFNTQQASAMFKIIRNNYTHSKA